MFDSNSVPIVGQRKEQERDLQYAPFVFNGPDGVQQTMLLPITLCVGFPPTAEFQLRTLIREELTAVLTKIFDKETVKICD